MGEAADEETVRVAHSSSGESLSPVQRGAPLRQGSPELVASARETLA